MRTSSPAVTARGAARPEGETIEADVLRRIGGGAPYFALKELVFDGTELRARAATETDPGAELGPLSAAELCRHAVVAAQCAVALGRPEGARCYYLTSSIDATLFPSSAPFGTPARYAAIATEQGPVGGAAQVEVRVENDLVGRVRVSYAVVPETLFARLFARHRSATFDDTGSHYAYPRLDALSSDKRTAEARVSIASSGCRGHFEQHPALPVTALFGLLVRLASGLVDGRFRVTTLRVRSPALAWAGDELRLRIAHAAGPWSFAGIGAVGGRTIANVTFGIAGADQRAS